MAAASVLVVDDDAVVTQSCHRILTEEGYRVETEQNGRNGLDRALQQDFDLVMTDLRMPDLDGMDLARSLVRERPDTAVVIITGYGTIPSAVEATKLGVSDYLEKPFTPREITMAVGNILTPRIAGIEDKDDEKTNVADRIRQVLKRASEDESFARDLLDKGNRVLAGVEFSSAVKATIASGDIRFIQEKCGEIAREEHGWLQRRNAFLF